MFRRVPLSIIRSFSLYTQQWCVIQVCWQLASRIRIRTVPSWSCSQAVWHIPLLCVQWKTRDDGQRNSLKHAEFYSQNKFEKLVHLVGFIMRRVCWHCPRMQSALSSVGGVVRPPAVPLPASGVGSICWQCLASSDSRLMTAGQDRT